MPDYSLSDLIQKAAFMEAGGGRESSLDKLNKTFDTINTSALNNLSTKKLQAEIIKSTLEAKKAALDTQIKERELTPARFIFGQSPQETERLLSAERAKTIPGETTEQRLARVSKFGEDNAAKIKKDQETYGEGTVQEFKDVPLAQFKAKQAGDQANATNAFKLNDDYVKALGTFQTVDDSYRRVIASAKNPSPAGDLSLLYNYMKILDPGSVVRETEFATAARTGSLPQEVQAYATRLLNGQRLTPEQRADFVNRAGGLYQTAAARKGEVDTQYTNKAKAYGVDPSLVVNTFSNPGTPEPTPTQKYVSPRQVKSAVAKGDLSPEEGQKILIDQFGYGQ